MSPKQISSGVKDIDRLIIISYKKYKVLENVIENIVQRPSEKE